MEPNPVRIEELLAHAGWVRKLAARLVRDAGTADDVTQEVWAYALRSPPRDRGNLRGWLAAVVHNAARSLGRSQTRRGEREARAVSSGAETAAVELVERGELHRRLVEQVLALEEPGRSIVLAHWFEGQSIARIARQKGLTARVARGRLETAHAQLRRRMDESSGGRAAWSVAFLKWTAAPAGLGGGFIMSKAGASSVGALLLVLAALVAWRVPWSSQGTRTEPPQQARLDAPIGADRALASPVQGARHSATRIVVIDECGQPVAGASVSSESTSGERALGTTDEHGALSIAPEDSSGPARVSHAEFEAAAIPELASPSPIVATLRDQHAITGRVVSYISGFHAESMTVVALEATAPDFEIAPERLLQAARRTTAGADGAFRLACLPADRKFTIIAGGPGWVCTTAQFQPWPLVDRGTTGIELRAQRLFAARMEFRDQDGELAQVFAPGISSGGMTNGSLVLDSMPVDFTSAEHVLGGVPEAWVLPATGTGVFLYTSNSTERRIAPNRLELHAVGYDQIGVEYSATTTAEAIETQAILLHRAVEGFCTVRVRFVTNGDRLASSGECPEGKLRIVPESGTPIEYGITGSNPTVEVRNVPVGRFRCFFVPRRGTGMLPDTEELAPIVELARGASTEFLVPIDSFGSVRLKLVGSAGARYTGQFGYSLWPAKRDSESGRFSRAGSSEIRVTFSPPEMFRGLRAGTWILHCVTPKPAEATPEAGEGNVVFELQPGEEKALTVRLRVP
jgi:RNA polymerase sigma factor (sigma-70 family)